MTAELIFGWIAFYLLITIMIMAFSLLVYNLAMLIICAIECLQVRKRIKKKSHEKPGSCNACDKLGIGGEGPPIHDTYNQQVLRKNNSNSMSDATSTGNNDSDEVGCPEDLSQPADNNIRNKLGRTYSKRGLGRSYGY